MVVGRKQWKGGFGKSNQKPKTLIDQKITKKPVKLV